MKLSDQCCSLEQAKKLKELGVAQNEIWMDIPGYEGLYKISNIGRVTAIARSGSKGGIMQSATSKGYCRVILCKNNVRKNWSIHRLVGFSFIPNPDNFPLINHKDGDKTNNRVSNLEWCNHKMNSVHAVNILGIGAGETNGRAKLTKREVDFMRYIKSHFPEVTAKAIGDFYAMSDVAICNIFNFKTWNQN